MFTLLRAASIDFVLFTSSVESFVTDIESLLRTISASVAVIGILGLGMMYLGSSLPLISEWKQSNPKAFRDVTWGLIFIIFASGGAIAALIPSS